VRKSGPEYTELLKSGHFCLPETREFRKLEQSYLTLAENEEWMADNLEKTNSPGADEKLVMGDAILAAAREAYARMPSGRTSQRI